MLDKKNAIRKEKSAYIFKCSHIECDNEVSAKNYYLNKHSGKCMKHSHQKKPFEHIFKRLVSTAKRENKEGTLTFDQFLEFTHSKKCSYCLSKIQWKEYAYVDNQFVGAAHFIDRKDNDGPYSKDNCVVCCSKCNFAKGNRYTYDEWYGMTAYFRNK